MPRYAAMPPFPYVSIAKIAGCPHAFQNRFVHAEMMENEWRYFFGKATRSVRARGNNSFRPTLANWVALLFLHRHLGACLETWCILACRIIRR